MMADRTARDAMLNEPRPLTPKEALDEVRNKRIRQIQSLNLSREEVQLYRNLLIEFVEGRIGRLSELRGMIEHSEESRPLGTRLQPLIENEDR